MHTAAISMHQPAPLMSRGAHLGWQILKVAKPALTVTLSALCRMLQSASRLCQAFWRMLSTVGHSLVRHAAVSGPGCEMCTPARIAASLLRRRG